MVDWRAVLRATRSLYLLRLCPTRISKLLLSHLSLTVFLWTVLVKPRALFEDLSHECPTAHRPSTCTPKFPEDSRLVSSSTTCLRRFPFLSYAFFLSSRLPTGILLPRAIHGHTEYGTSIFTHTLFLDIAVNPLIIPCTLNHSR